MDHLLQEMREIDQRTFPRDIAVAPPVKDNFWADELLVQTTNKNDTSLAEVTHYNQLQDERDYDIILYFSL